MHNIYEYICVERSIVHGKKKYFIIQSNKLDFLTINFFIYDIWIIMTCMIKWCIIIFYIL